LVGYESLLRTCVLPMFGPVPLARIEQPAVAAWVAEMRGRGLSASRTRQAYRVLSGMLDSAVQGGYLAKSPCAGIKLPRMVRRDAVILTAGQVDDLAEAASPYGTLIYLLAYGGLRWGEAAALRRRRCDLLRGRLEVAEAVSDVNGHLCYGSTKTYERRWVRIPTFLVELLARQLETVPAAPEALVFIGLRGAPLRYQSFRRADLGPGRDQRRAA
jgi:integrase